jgi:hypothetical protein
MYFAKKCAWSVSAFALAVALSASQANAQGLNGTFNLPFQAHWGQAVLEPGEYVVRLSAGMSMYPVIYVSGQGQTIMVSPSTYGATASERSYLRIENVAQTHVIREFHSGVAGELFTFPIPKSVMNEAALARNAPDMTVSVASSGGN